MNHVKISGVDINLDIVSKMKPDKVKALDIFENKADYAELQKHIDAMKAKPKKPVKQ
jgi:hypothetical protein